jgi:hypothetical protein
MLMKISAVDSCPAEFILDLIRRPRLRRGEQGESGNDKIYGFNPPRRFYLSKRQKPSFCHSVENPYNRIRL